MENVPDSGFSLMHTKSGHAAYMDEGMAKAEAKAEECYLKIHHLHNNNVYKKVLCI